MTKAQLKDALIDALKDASRYRQALVEIQKYREIFGNNIPHFPYMIGFIIDRALGDDNAK